MDIENELTKLYNTMALIETKGEGTKLMAQCLNFLEALRSRVIAEKNANIEENAHD